MQQFFFTNRAVFENNGIEHLDTRNSAGASMNLRFGYIDLTSKKVELIQDIKIESDGGADTYRTVDYKKDKKKGSAEWFHRLYDDMCKDDAKNDTLVFIHGFQCGFDCFIENMRHLKASYVDNPNSNIARIVGFTWPSNNNLLQYPADRADAIYAGEAFARGWHKLLQFFHEVVGVDKRCGNAIHLLAHSLGCQVFEQMVASVNKSRFSGIGQVFNEIILAAPDIQHDAFEKGNPLHSINNFCERMHVYTHKSDDALRISKYTKNFESRLGKNGPISPFNIPGNVTIVDCSKVKDQKTGKEKLIDHWYYKRSATVVSDIELVLNGEDHFSNRSYISNQNKYQLLSEPD